MDKASFKAWAKSNNDFLRLYLDWNASGRHRHLIPSVILINPKKGYTANNMLWVTHGLTAGLSGRSRRINNQQVKEIYKLIGVPYET